MANPSTLYGFAENGLIDGASPTFGMMSGLISPENTVAIYGGDVSLPIASGYYAAFPLAVGGGAPVGGIFVPDFTWLSLAAGMRRYNRAWLGAIGDLISAAPPTCKLVVNPQAVFRVRSAGTSGSPVTAAQVGLNANFYLGPTPGNNLISRFGLDDLSIGAGASLPFKIIGLVAAPESDPTSIYNEVFVKFNNLAT